MAWKILVLWSFLTQLNSYYSFYYMWDIGVSTIIGFDSSYLSNLTQKLWCQQFIELSITTSNNYNSKGLPTECHLI